MASLAVLRANTLIYLGTTAADKAFPAATLNMCLNNAVNAILADIDETAPSWLELTITLTSTTQAYTLPADFSKWQEVRLDDANGSSLTEVRSDELNATGGYAFALTGPDHAAILTTGSTISAGNPLYLKYRAWPADLAADADQPDMIPRKFHDVIALVAAEEATALGGEGVLSPSLIRRQVDRHAQLMMHVARRGTEIMSSRGSAFSQQD